MHLMNTFSVKR